MARSRAPKVVDIKPREDQDEEEEPRKAPFVESPVAQEIGTRLIGDYHAHLKEARILYLFSGKKMTSQGRQVLSKTMRMGDMHRFLSALGTTPPNETPSLPEADFAIVLNREAWDETLNEAQRQALIDHALCHAIRTQKGEWGIRTHSVEEFSEIIERHGLIFEDTQSFAQAVVDAAQMAMPLEAVGAAT